MVCLGNICRSPLAEGILQSKLNDEFTVDSAGTISMHEGEHPDKRSIKVASNHGLDISKQKSRPITHADLQNFDIIYGMDRNNVKDILSLCTSEVQRAKVKLFLQEAEIEGSQEVPDPYWGDLNDFEAVYQLIDTASEIIANKLMNK